MTSPLLLPLAFALGWLSAHVVSWIGHELRTRASSPTTLRAPTHHFPLPRSRGSRSRH